MKEGDLVKFRGKKHERFKETTGSIGLIVELQTRGPVPGAYVLWSSNRTTEWVSIENLKKV